jgi:DNA modification methylase
VPIPPGGIRDSIMNYLSMLGGDAALKDISAAVEASMGKVSPSSVRSYLNLNVPALFERTGRGRYRLRDDAPAEPAAPAAEPVMREGPARLYHDDCFAWLAQCEPRSVHAVVTDPPYGLIEYSAEQQRKLRAGRGGVWRIPPSFDGHLRSPLPRFTVLDAKDRAALFAFFQRLGGLIARVAVPGANVIVASNPLLFHIIVAAMAEAGLEPRGSIARLTMTMRGGDRPKNAHAEFDGVSVLPRSMWEPWAVLRKPLEGRVQDNLRKWKTGGFRRPSADKPFGDVIRSSPASKLERSIAPHPSLKPQSFLRQVVRASLPLGEGIVLDPFAGSGSTLAAAIAVGYGSVGVESDANYIRIAQAAIPRLAALAVTDP